MNIDLGGLEKLGGTINIERELSKEKKPKKKESFFKKYLKKIFKK